MPIAIDAGKLEYISSVGLRILLKFTKEQSGTKLTVQDVSSEVLRQPAFCRFWMLPKPIL